MCNYHKYLSWAALKAYLLIQRFLFCGFCAKRKKQKLWARDKEQKGVVVSEIDDERVREGDCEQL